MSLDTAPYGSWRSPITAEFITTGVTGLSALASHDDALYWLESRPAEAGRTTLMTLHDGAIKELTPAPYNVRSRVHEYGGGAYAATPGGIFFVNFSDQNLYRANLDGAPPTRITAGTAETRYADFVYDERHARLISVMERPGPNEPENCLVAIDVATGVVTDLVRGHDFYAAPRIAPGGAQLCFLSWDHPNMPWDGTQLHVGEFDAGGALMNDTIVAGGAAESIVQPEWMSAERIVFASDQSGFWNLYSYDSSGIYCIYSDAAEYAAPAWSFGARHFVALGPRHVVAQRIHNGAATMSIIDIDRGIATPLPSDWQVFDALTVSGGRIYCIAGRSDRLQAIIWLDPAGHDTGTVAAAGRLGVDSRWFSTPESIEFATRDGQFAHAYFYAPHNPEFTALPAELPPLLVMSHGGPTSAAQRSINFRIQYYTSRGWAVVDVDYGGSSGFGRAYRTRLDGNWGVVDVHDCEDAVGHLARAHRIDPNRVAIRGSSAGGYTTLAALTFGETFRAGASHYGIGDLEALARDTHKFESRYLERLIGPYPQARDVYVARSPIHHVDRLKCPVVFFQGLEDRIVPPNQAQAMVDALRRKQLPVAYVAFAGEQHGFRQADNIKRALDGEYLFFARVFGFEPADTLPELPIENLGSHLVTTSPTTSTSPSL
jgi:dipeptidyl aminopeptidase/acylaminoacyl peptidase